MYKPRHAGLACSELEHFSLYGKTTGCTMDVTDSKC